MSDKVWTQEQLGQANVALWERFDHLPVEHKDAQIIQCELTEAVELLRRAQPQAFANVTVCRDWNHRQQELLKRNSPTPQESETR